MAKKPAKKEVKKVEMVIITCICKNVHLGNGKKLRAEQNEHGNWVNGESAEVPAHIAKMLIESGQCK